jgi:hypothetical protein
MKAWAVLVLGLAAACGGRSSSTGSGEGAGVTQTMPSVAATGGGGATLNLPPPAKAVTAADVDVARILGGKADGWLPPVLAKLRRGMTPAEADKILPGAAKGDSAFHQVSVDGVPGLKSITLYFASSAKGGPASDLHTATLVFDPVLASDDAFYDKLVDASAAKWGPVKPESKAKKLITFIGPDFVSTQLTKDPISSSYELAIDVPKK